MTRRNWFLTAIAVLLLAGMVAVYAQGYLTVRIEYDGSGNPLYIGQSVPGTAQDASEWQIYKLTYDGSGNVVSKLYANGSWAFSFKWSLRATYTYSN